MLLVFFLAVAVLPPFLACHVEDEVYDFYANQVRCDEVKVPDNCELTNIPLMTVEDISRCAPAKLSPAARNYYLGWSGRGVTYRENKRAFQDIFIKGKMLRDVSDNSLEVTVLGQKVAFPIGIAPAALQMLANPAAENATASAAAAFNTIMILSSSSSLPLEEVAEKVKGKGGHLWMQLYIQKDRQSSRDIVRRAERSGFKAIVLTVDAYLAAERFCDASRHPEISGAVLGNYQLTFGEASKALITFQDITWLKSITKLPIVAKGIVTGGDAVKAIRAGASAVMVSNHGGRQLDGLPGSIDSLLDVVAAVKRKYPRREVYFDGGIRNGFDVFKAIARGAKMVFVGRPAIWGLTLDGQKGVETVLSILKAEFNETMIGSGNANPQQISGDDIIPSVKGSSPPRNSPEPIFSL